MASSNQEEEEGGKSGSGHRRQPMSDQADMRREVDLGGVDQLNANIVLAAPAQGQISELMLVRPPYAKRQLFTEDVTQEGRTERAPRDYFVELPSDDHGVESQEMTVFQQEQFVDKVLVMELSNVSLKRKVEDQGVTNEDEPIVKRRRGLEERVEPTKRPGKTRKGPRARFHRGQEEASSSWEEQTPWQERWKQVLSGDYVFQAGERSGGRPSSTTQAP